jgi:hypothetical protein
LGLEHLILRKFPVNSLHIREFDPRDEFAADWFHHHRWNVHYEVQTADLCSNRVGKPPAGGAIRRIDVIIRVDRDPAPAAG